jgi:hypothetical protein
MLHPKRYTLDVWLKNHPLSFKHPYNELIMDDFMIYIDGWWI